MATKKAETPKKVKITLEYDTDHGDRIVPAGEEIEVYEDQAKRITEAHALRKAQEAKTEA